MPFKTRHVMPRLLAIPNYYTGAGVAAASPNLFNLLNLPAATTFGNPALDGISDFGPYPANMTARNAFRGPGAWNFDVALSKTFPITERFGLEFRAEGFNIFNHANMYVVASNADAGNFSGAPSLSKGRREDWALGLPREQNTTNAGSASSRSAFTSKA